jgi:hypothetical protein
MILLQWFIAITFWLSYLAIAFASIITISDFVQRVTQKAKKPPPEVKQDSVKLHISEGQIEVNRYQMRNKKSKRI